MFDPTLTGNEIVGSYDLWLVLLSYVIAAFASFTALDLAVRIGESHGTTRKIWIGGCALAMGGGIWSMHFTAMLAFKLPLAVTYNIWITLLSLIIAVIGSGIGFFLANSRPILISNIVKGGALMGIGVALMHYSGMAAMEFAGSMHYKSSLFILSVLIAILAATAALGLISYFGKKEGGLKFPLKIAGALTMGVAVFGMHYTGMAATIYIPQDSILPEVQSTSDVRLLAFSVSGITTFILGLAIIASITQEEFNRLKGVKDELEFLVQERTKELNFAIENLNSEIQKRKANEEKLEFAKGEAQAASQAKTEFLARMSHELRTPMNAILGFSQLFEMNHEKNLTETQQKNIRSILQAGKHLLGLIDEVLDITSIDQGKITTSLENVDLNSLIQELIVLVISMADQRSIKILNRISEHDLVVRADRNHLKQVLLNLISNAIKYNKDHGLVTVEGNITNEGRVQISVIDTGYGIPKDQLEKLFEPFSRLDTGSDAEIEGTGLGLTIAKKLIENMHGSILVDSAPGEGSCFTIELPAGDKVESKDQSLSSQVDQPDETTLKRTYTLLYVEDNPLNLEVVKQILNQHRNVKFLSASNGKLGLELAQNHNPDVILLDLHLPGMNGQEIFTKLKGNNNTSAIPVIALSADAMECDIKKTLNLGFRSYIAKPIDVPLFLETIDKILNLNSTPKV